MQIETGDARSLPFGDSRFDVVLTHWVVHNLPTSVDQRKALDEMLRVLRPGGTLVFADIKNHDAYRAHLRAAGLRDVREATGGAEARIMGFLSAGNFRPRAFVGRLGARE